jgi:lipopolysaccharide export system protein LptC
MRRPFVDTQSGVDPPVSTPWHPRYGRSARAAKIALPLLAVGLATLIFAWSQINPVIERLQISETEHAPEEIDAITMENARFGGVDSQNRTFNITAARAIQSVEDSNNIRLFQPRADIALADGAKVAIQSDTGGLQRNTQILDLFGAVTMIHDRGYEFRTAQARIDLNQQTAAGDAPFEGHGPLGWIRAEGFEILDGGARVIFRGRSRAVFEPESDRGSP